MTVLSVNKINVGLIIAATEEPRGERRNIGNESPASDGTLRTTRQTRKKDEKFKTIPLSLSDSHVWESLFTGEGEVWSFDSSLYGSKGLGPSAIVGCSVTAGSAKYGAGKLNVPATTGSISYLAAVNSFGYTVDWTLLVWRSTDGGSTYTHYVIRSDNAKWVDGVRNDSASTTWLSVSSGTITIYNTSGSAVLYDDLVILPYKILTTWPAQIYAAGSAFPPLPYLDLSGDFVTEQASRRVLGNVSEARVKTASGVKSKLEVELKAR